MLHKVCQGEEPGSDSVTHHSMTHFELSQCAVVHSVGVVHRDSECLEQEAVRNGPISCSN